MERWEREADGDVFKSVTGAAVCVRERARLSGWLVVVEP